MNITINVDETQFKEILDRELKDLPKEDIQEIIKQALTQYIMSNPELVKNLLITNRISRYSNEYTPTPIMEDIVKSIDFSKECEEVAQALKNELIGNSRKVLEELMLKSIARSMLEGMKNNGWLEEEFVHMHTYAHYNNG